MAIRLPSLLQKIKVDTSDLSKAEAQASGFSKKYSKSMGAVADATDDAADSHGSLRDEADKLSRTLKSTTPKLSKYQREIVKFNKASADTDRDSNIFRRSLRRMGDSMDNVDVSVLTGILPALKVPAIAAAISFATSAIAGLSAAIGAIVAQFGPMTGVVAAAIPAFIGLKGAIFAVKSAMEIEAGAQFAEDIQNIGQGLKEAAGEAALPGLEKALKNATPTVNALRDGLAAIGKSTGAGAATFIERFQGIGGDTKLKSLLEGSAPLVERFADAAVQAANAFLNIGNAVLPIANLIADDLVGAMGRLSAYTETADLGGFFQRAYDVMKSFLGSMANLGKAIKNVFSIGAEAIGIDFVGGLESGTQKMLEFTESSDGIAKIKDFFADAGPVVRELGLLLKDVLAIFIGLGDNQELAPLIKSIRTDLLPAVQTLAEGVSGNMGPAMVSAATAFIKFTDALSFSPLIAAVKIFADLAIKILDLAAAVPGLGPLLATLVVLGKSMKVIGLVGKVTGLTGFVTSLGAIGPAGAAGQRGVAGLIQGFRGVDKAAAQASGTTRTAANLIGGGFRNLGKGAKNAGSAIGRGLVGGIRAGGRGAAAAGSAIGRGAITAASSAVSAGGAALKGIGGVFANIGKAALPALKGLASGLRIAATAFRAFSLALLTNPIFLVIAAIVALVAAFVYLWKNNEGFRNFIIGLWEGIKNVITTVVNAIKTVVLAVFNAIKAYVMFVFNVYKTIIVTAWNVIKTVITTVVNVIWTVIQTIFNAIKAYFTFVFNVYKTIITTAINVIRTVITTVFNVIRTVITTVMNVIRAVITTVWNVIRTVITTVVNVIKSVISGAFNLIKSIIQGAMNFVLNIVRSAWNAIRNAVQGGVSGVLGLIRSLPGRILSALGNLGRLLFNAGKNIIQGLIDGIKNMVGRVGETIGNVASTIRNFLPFSPAKEGPLKRYPMDKAGENIVSDLASGIGSQGSEVRKEMNQLLGGLGNGVRVPVNMEAQSSYSFGKAAPQGGEAGKTVIYNITINETSGPTTEQSITRRLRQLELAGVGGNG